MGNGLRLLLVARKSRKGDDDEDTRYARQEHRNRERAEREGHVVVEPVRDTVSSQVPPWERKNLKAWMTDPGRLALYDGILVETDRLSRADDEGWHTIETWCYDHGKKILTTEGVQFPPRDDADRYQWVSLKRRARTYWEDVRDKHAQTREIIKANGAAIGPPPFGYRVVGEKYAKRFEIDPVWGPVALEAFERIANGETGSAVAVWLSGKTGRPWRIKRVLDMIRRRTYLGERDGHTFEPLVTQQQWDDANSALAARSFPRGDTGGRRVQHGYSGLITCECGAQFYRHKSDRGQAKYRCGRGRRGDVTEGRCGHGAPVFDAVNDAVDAVMGQARIPEYVITTTGGDHARQTELARLQDAMSAAMARKDMARVTRLAAEFAEADQRPAEPIRTTLRATGRTYADVWAAAGLSDRRALLSRGDFRVVVREHAGQWQAELTWTLPERAREFKLQAVSNDLPLRFSKTQIINEGRTAA